MFPCDVYPNLEKAVRKWDEFNMPEPDAKNKGKQNSWDSILVGKNVKVCKKPSSARSIRLEYQQDFHLHLGLG